MSLEHSYIVPPAKLKGLGEEPSFMTFVLAHSSQKAVPVGVKRDEHTSFPKNGPSPFMMSKFHVKSR